MLEAHFHQRIRNTTILREFIIQDTTTKGRKTVSYELLDATDCTMPEVLDAFVLGTIFHLMKLARPLRVWGNISRSTMINLQLFQEAWHNMRPDRYRVVDIIPDAVVDLTPSSPARSITLFSGGLDSTFTVLQLKTDANYSTLVSLTDALLVHGFDIRFSDQRAFELTVSRMEPFLRKFGLHLKRIRTNSKDVFDDWEDSFGAQMAACLQQCNEYRYGFLPSSEPYSSPVYPWGSTPATDPLLSTDQISVVHHGAGYSRTEKARYLLQHPDSLSHLRVCWEGKDQFKNCGSCEKCVRTQLNFWANGVKTIPCFEDPLNENLILDLQIRNQAQFNEFTQILDYARLQGLAGQPWARKLERRLRFYNSSFSRSVQSQAKKIKDSKGRKRFSRIRRSVKNVIYHTFLLRD